MNKAAMNKPVKLAMKLNSTQEIIDDIRAGKMVVIMDDVRSVGRRRAGSGRGHPAALE